MVTGEQVRNAMKDAGITVVDHHTCGICGVMVFYSRDNDQLFFNSGCGCMGSPPQPRNWDDAAEWINMQSVPEIRQKLATKFGLGEL